MQLPIITSSYLARHSNVRFGMSTRTGGISPEPLGMNLSFRVGDEPANVEENRRRLFSRLGMDLSRLALPLQVHSSLVRAVGRPGEYESCDGLITNVPNLPLAVSVADCLPIVLFEPVRSVLGVVHAGWRGTSQGIVSVAVELMVREFSADTGRIVAFIGPAASVCCYEVGSEVAELFSLQHIEQRDNRLCLDLKHENADALLSSGLKRENIEISNLCTICRPDLFHSYRRDRNRSGRMMGVASILGS